MTDQQIRLQFGELNASEMRLARAIVGWHERQMEELKRWKAEAQAVEAEWNPQDLAKMLGATLGQSCRQVIQKRVPEILAENAKLRAAADGLAEALKGLVAVNENHNEAIFKLIGKPLGWKDTYLDASREALAAYENHKKQIP